MKSLLTTLVWLFTGIIAQAQSEWTAVMQQSSYGQAYKACASLSELETFILEQSKKDRVVNEVAYGNGHWYGVATEVPVKTNFFWNWNESFPSEWISKKWKEKSYLTKLTYGDGRWFAIMTDQTPFQQQSWARRDTWDDVVKFAREKWAEDTKYNITDIAYGDGKWYVIMSLLKQYEAQTFKESVTFPNDWIDTKYKDGYNITSIEHDGTKWYLVMSKQSGNPAEIVFNPQEDFPEKKIKDNWDKNKRISSLAFARDEDDDDYAALAAYFEGLANEDKKTNAQKAADNLAAKNYPEAIKYYKAAIADDNTQEVLYNNLAWAQYLNGSCTEALENVNKAISIKSTSYNNHTKGSILKCQNKCSEAIRFYDEAIRLYRKEHEKFTTSDYYSDRAAVKRCLGNYSAAIEDIELALTITPGDAELKKSLNELNKLAGNK